MPSGSWSCGREAGAMQHAIDAVERARAARRPCSHSAIMRSKNGLLHRAVRLGHRQQERHRLPGAGGVHVGDEAGQFAQHARGGGARHRSASPRRAAACARRSRARVAAGAKRLHSMEKPSSAMRGSGHAPPPLAGGGRGRGPCRRRWPLSPPPTPSRKGRACIVAPRKVSGTHHKLLPPLTASPPAARRSAASPSGRCRSAPAPWSAPA